MNNSWRERREERAQMLDRQHALIMAGEYLARIILAKDRDSEIEKIKD